MISKNSYSGCIKGSRLLSGHLCVTDFPISPMLKNRVFVYAANTRMAWRLHWFSLVSELAPRFQRSRDRSQRSSLGHRKWKTEIRMSSRVNPAPAEVRRWRELLQECYNLFLREIQFNSRVHRIFRGNHLPTSRHQAIREADWAYLRRVHFYEMYCRS
jgi:hypothetical protein